jgi:hypothetical protein
MAVQLNEDLLYGYRHGWGLHGAENYKEEKPRLSPGLDGFVKLRVFGDNDHDGLITMLHSDHDSPGLDANLD